MLLNPNVGCPEIRVLQHGFYAKLLDWASFGGYVWHKPLLGVHTLRGEGLIFLSLFLIRLSSWQLPGLLQTSR